MTSQSKLRILLSDPRHMFIIVGCNNATDIKVLRAMTDKMDSPQVPQTSSPGDRLKHLSGIAQISIRPKVRTCATLSGLEQTNEHEIRNDNGEHIYLAIEEACWLYRNIFRSIRGFHMTVMDNSSNRVIHLHRRLACDSCCCPCWLQKMTVFSPPEQVIGTIEQTWSLWKPKFSLKNAAGDIVLKIKGPQRPINIGISEVNFRVLNIDGAVVGKISKKWLNMTLVRPPSPTIFRVSFPESLNVESKALLLGAAFLIDSMFFEGLTITYSNSSHTNTH